MDLDAGHLSAVETLQVPGVSTMRCRLPDACPVAEIKALYGGASGILLSEVNP